MLTDHLRCATVSEERERDGLVQWYRTNMSSHWRVLVIFKGEVRGKSLWEELGDNFGKRRDDCGP